MGQRGPLPKGDNIRYLTGQGGKPTGSASTTMDTTPPGDLGKRQGRVFTEIASALNTLGHVNDADRYTVAMLAELTVLHNDLMEAATTDTTPGSTGQDRADPRLELALKVFDSMFKLWQQLGMTPAARTRLGVKAPAEGDPLADYMSR